MRQRILRPLDYGGLLDELFDLYKRNFLLMTGIAAIVYLPLNMAINAATGSMFNPLGNGKEPSFGAFGALMAIVLLSIPVTYAVVAAITWAISRCYLGEKPTILGSYKAIWPRLLPFILTMILISIMYVAGFAMCCLPGIALTILLAFVSEVFIIEDKEYVEAIKRSWQLAASDWARVFVVGIITGLLVVIVQSILTSPFQIIAMLSAAKNPTPPSWFYLLQGLAGGISQALVLPIQVIAYVLLYYDIRVRKEGFDIEMLAQSMGGAPANDPNAVS